MAEDINERHKRKQEQIERWLSAWQDKVKGGDPEKITQQLENSLAAERIKVNEARKKNAALKGLLYDLKLLLPDEKANGT
jgi:hypothetical protein